MLGALVTSTHVKLELSNTTHESNIASPTSATTSVMLFHINGFESGEPVAVKISVNPSASILG